MQFQEAIYVPMRNLTPSSQLLLCFGIGKIVRNKEIAELDMKYMYTLAYAREVSKSYACAQCLEAVTVRAHTHTHTHHE